MTKALYRYFMLMLLLLTGAGTLHAADDCVIRYVSTSGDISNSGTSWAAAKNNLQNAIDEVYEAVRGTTKKGYVFVAGSEEGMTFVPTRRSTDDADGSVFNTSFRIYAGVRVYGGFKGDEVPTDPEHPELLPLQRIMSNEHTYERVSSDIDADNIGETVRRWNFKYKTILSGNHSTHAYSFTYSENRGIYSTTYPLSSYHVVWFATNGKIEPNSSESDLVGHFQALTDSAVVDGFTIEGGYASSIKLKDHDHTGYGGGVYMVKKAVLRNCIVHHCAATQRGGAVYMDGGGEVDRCYIHTSQATGYGMQQGYGGGVCIDYDGAVRHTYIIQCAARIGAGLAICHTPHEYPEATVFPDEANRATPYDPFANATVVSNCTSNAEGGGVYLDDGGTLNHCTIVNNKCVGPDVIYYGRRHARTGGIYVKNRGTLYNTVAWGNLSPVNNDVQFASFKDASSEMAGKRIAVYHCAFSRSDITDWSTATKENVVSLTNENTPEKKDAAGNFPIFNRPTAQAGIQYASDGSVDPTATGDGQPYQRVYNWHPLAASKLRQKGMQVNEALQGITAEVLHARTETDIIGRKFEAISCIGAMAQSYRTQNLTPPLLPSLEKGEEGQLIPTLLVSPNRKVYGPENDKEYDESGNLIESPEKHAGYLDNNNTGQTWEHPIGNLGNAIRSLKRRQWTSGEKKDWYNIGGTKNSDGTFTGGTNYEHVQICVKEGSINTAGPDCYLGTQARTASLRPASNMRIYGSYPASNTSTNIDGRNQRLYPTKVSSNVLQSTYMNNGAHVFALINVHDVVIDGFRLYDGNANINAAGSYSSEAIRYGGGVIVNNTSRPQAERIDMTGNIIRNCVIANCSAPDGAAIYVNGNNLNSEGKHCRAELSVINCVIRNNTAGDMHGNNEWFVYKEDAEYEDPNAQPGDHTKNHKTESAVVTANGNAHIWIRNCDIMNNCGYAMEGMNSHFDPMNSETSEGDMFQIEIYNSILFSNGQMIRSDRNGIQHPVTCKWSEQRSIIGNYIYIDWDAPKPPVPDDVKCFNFLTRMRERDRKYITSDGTATGTPLKSYVDVYGQQRYATEHGDIDGKPLQWRYPYFVNPSRNVGHSEDGDRPLYGGTVSYEPLNMNPIVNGGNPLMETGGDRLPVNNTMTFDGSGNPQASETNLYHHNCKSMAYDAAWQPRTYGGAPDAGAVEDLRLPKSGTVIYVTPEGAGKRDGSSWSNAIQGNAVYQLDDVPGPALATGDMLDTTNGTDRVISSSGDASTAEAAVLTTDSKYNGGFGRSWFTDWKTGGTSTTTVTKAWITEKNVYVGGARNGEEEVLQDGSTPTETSETTITSSGSNLTGFTAGYHYDPRYPYGEISGASRSFWRANPYHNGTDWNNGANYSDKDAFITACNNNGWINNERQERYLSGLQYAVEKAAAYNALAEDDPQRIAGVDSVMVWVGNGKYTDYKGFIMRDNTTVMGSFPVSRGGTPGLSERQALMSDVISIPKSLPAQDFDAKDYETILQISDTDPETDSETLNEDAVMYWDDDYSVLESTDTQTTREEERTIIHNYIWDDQGDDVSETYMLYPDMLKGTSSVFGDRHKTDQTAPSGGETVGGVTWSAGAKYVYQYFGSQSGGNNSWELVYANRTNNVDYNSFKFEGDRNVIDGSGNVIDVVKRGMELSGGMINMSVWQTMKNVPAGNYRIQADLAAFYRALNNGHDTGDEDTGITFYVIGSDGTVLTSQTIYCTNPSIPYQLKRYTFDFTQPADGDLTIRIMAAPGTKATDPASGNLPALKDNPNRREVMMANVHLFKRGDYKYILGNTISNSNVIGSSDPVVTNLNTYTLQTHRTTLRKRVLTMPDVCVPTYGAGSVGDPAVTDRGKFVDNLCHTHRVTGATKAKRTSWENSGFVKEDPNYVEYSDVFWDGFTIRHGFIADEGMAHGGGAGVNLYEGAHLQNCIVIHNMSYSARVKGGGLFCDGATSTIEGCFVLNNTSTRGTNTVQDQIFAGGMFMYEGTCFNSLFAKNYSYGSAGGLGFCVGRFYNNTIAYNTCTLKEGGQYSGGAISLATSSSPNLFVANTIIFGNNGIAIRDRNTGDGKVNPFLHCYVQSEVAQPNNATKKNVTNWTASNTGNYGIGNVFLNGVAPSADNTPFAADIASGSYDASNPGAKEANDFRLTSELQDCINKGTEDFAGNLLTALIYKGKKENEIRNLFIYKSVEASVLPENDVAFARRVQDCQIDMGAYEFDGSKFIEPDLSEDGKAIFYVSQNGSGGLATASTVEDAACMVKLQKVLDAAGRWKYAANFYTNTDPEGEHYNMTNFDQATLEKEITIGVRRQGKIAADANLSASAMADSLATLKDRTVIVKLAGDYYRDGSGNYTPSFFKYVPTRSTVTDETQEENLLEYSFMVPRGVQVMGGYTEAAVTVGETEYPGFSDVTRDALGNHTRLSGEVYNTESGSTGNTFHVVTFVEDLFDPNEKLYVGSDGKQLKGQLRVFSTEKDRAVLDGLYIQEGYANGTDSKDQQGAGAVVTDYAHIRNCIVQYNEAAGEGGGLYMKPHALVSGCVVKENAAFAGGGIFVEEPATVGEQTYAHIIASTVVFNSAQTVAGGLHFETNVRANSSAFWRNTANDLSNVAGTFGNSSQIQVEENCPFNYCGVESRRISGVNNIELPVAEDEGVRWDHSDPHEVKRWCVFNNPSATRSDSIYYYPINLSSILGRAGMTYAAYENLRVKYPTIELTDIAGLNRMAQTAENEFVRLADGSPINKAVKDNDFIEMGARVLNGTFELHVEYSHVMTRLFVSTTQLLPSEEALTLQANTPGEEMAKRGVSYAEGSPEYLQIKDDVEMYKQMGSSFLNPFHRLGDALQYIVRVRTSDDPFDSNHDGVDDTTVGDYYKDQRFEIFVTGGTFYPFRDAHGKQGEARANTFVVPEEVSIVGGCDRVAARHNYCQATDGTLTVAGYTFDCEPTEKIRADRERLDRNGNHVKEPWEMMHQTILSGNAVNNAGSDNTNVYHVITCFPDQSRVGKLPTRKDNAGNELPALLKKYEDDGKGNEVEVTPTRVELLENLEKESSASRDKRTIIIDGVTVTGGHANDIENQDVVDNFQLLTYFRGGGILVEGNWDDTFNSKAGLPEVLGVAKRDITLITTNCLFQDNMAANGGAVYTNGTYYAFGCHFTKNTSRGPNTEIDQRYIPWTAGGAIANNYNVHAWNSLFDNNEAKRGNLPILTEMEDDEHNKYANPVHDSDNRQGYAGAISCSETGLVRVGNCDFVRNKAVAFPAIYNFFDNNLRAYSGIVYDDYQKFIKDHSDHSGETVGSMDGKLHGYAYFKKELDDYYYGKGHHFAVNSIFWGNEATGSTVNAATWQGIGYYNWRENDYDLPPDYETDTEHTNAYYTEPDGWTDKREPKHIANFGPFMDISTLTFCAFEEGTGREGTVWYDNQNNAKSAQVKAKGSTDGLSRLYAGDFVDVLYEYFGFYPDGHPDRPIYKKIDQGGGKYKIVPCAPNDPEALIMDGETERKPTDEEKASAIAYNYNLILDPENLDANGPYFVQPSITAGEDGYMETADWLVSRLNRTVDTGWGMLKQKVEQAGETSGLLSTTLLKTDETPVTSETNQYTDLWGEGFYNLHSKNIYNRFKDVGFANLLPIGDEPYMEYTTEGTNITSNMRRISTHPKAGVQDVYIDMGIYEYQYVQLVTGGDQTDVIWVTTMEDPSVVCDGSTWKKATSDLQGAIETLLLSRNDHDKMIKLISGNYSPIRMTEGNQRAFFINMPSRNTGVVLPAGVVTADNTYSVRSLTIRGGYTSSALADDNDGEATRDPEQNPTMLIMTREPGNTDHQLEHLFIIEDAEMKGTYMNYLTKDNKDFKETVMTISFEGITFCNPYGNHHHPDGGSAIYYMDQYRTQDLGGESFEKDQTQLLKPGLDGSGNPMPKLIIKDCIFAANGKDEETPAVKIGKGGGHTLIVNSLFHSNSGSPIDAVNTTMVNCTSALNGGYITLHDETERYHDGTSRTFPSALHNCILWRDDQNHGEARTAMFINNDLPESNPARDITDTKWSTNQFTHNAYTRYATEPDGTTEADSKGNFLLSTENDDVLLGPNFIQPYFDIPAGTDETEKLGIKLYLRNFHIGPSAHILNRASSATYIAQVPYYAETSTTEEKEVKSGEGGAIITTKYWFHSVQHSSPAVLTEAMLKGTDPNYQERELAHQYRWKNSGIERGAYECTASVERVLYVWDGSTGQEDGTTWEHAFHLDDMQKALDVASVYSLTSSPQERAYVFVKSDDHAVDALKLRDGVSVYGSIAGSYSDEVIKNTETDHYDDDKIESYISKMTATRSGIATKNVTHNTVKGLVSENNSPYLSGFLLDGFYITGGESATTPVNMAKDKTVLRNVVITGNTVTDDGQPVINAAKGLLYNTLIYGNTAGSTAPVVSVGANGYVLNCTVVPETGQTALVGETGAAHVQNTIDATTSSAMFAPYRRPVDQQGNTGYTNVLPSYLTSHRPYWYQLHEESKEINAGTDDMATSQKDGDNSIAKLFPDYVDFSHDRDPLGNPRRLGGRVDNGCFETWRITGNKYVTNATDGAYALNYGGHLYPHSGSVVYLEENANMVVNTNEGTPLFNDANALQPGYVLLKKGASVYGQGNTLRFEYVAAERSLSGVQYGLMAFPFDHDPRDAYYVAHNSDTDVLTQTNLKPDVYTYDSEKRSKYDYYGDRSEDKPDYSFHDDNSTCWKTSTVKQLATEGWLLKYDEPHTCELRLTGWGATEGNMAYTENGSDKTVTLRQYNSHVMDANKYPRFTRMEHMGWNLKGQPWLVADFATDGTNPDFKMDVPHLFYDMNADGSYNYADKSASQFYTKRSWEAGTTVTIGQAFFTQTAIIGTEEELTFKLPQYTGDKTAPDAASRQLISLTDDNGYGDVMEVMPKEDADPAMPYRVGSDGVKWFAFSDVAPQFYLLNADGTPLSLESAAPLETELPVGLRKGKSEQLTIALPQPEAFADYSHVWLTDHKEGTVTDLLETSYSFAQHEDAYDEQRLTLRFGGARPVMPDEQQSSGLVIYSSRQHIIIKGLQEGDLIDIYNAGGAQRERCRATSSDYRRRFYDGIYIVRVISAANGQRTVKKLEVR